MGLIRGNNCPNDTPTEWLGALDLGLNTSLFPFNLTAESRTSLSYDSRYSMEVPIDLIPVFDQNYTEMWIGLEGYISFGGPYRSGRFDDSPQIQEQEPGEPIDVQALFVYHCPGSFSVADGPSVHFDEITEEAQRCRLGNLLRQTDPPAAPLDFIPTRLLVVTWYNVTCGVFFGGQLGEQTLNIEPLDPSSHRGHTFQGVIATDGTLTFVVYIYAIIPDDDDDDDGENPNIEQEFFERAEVGYDMFSDLGLIEFRVSLEDGISTIGSTTNRDGLPPGIYIYQIDGEMYSPPDCMPGPLRVNERYALQCGGKRIFLFGPCYYNEPDVKCNFGGILVNAVVVDNSTAYCVTPFIAAYGYINLTVSLDGGTTYGFATDFYIIGFDDRYQIDLLDFDGFFLQSPYTNLVIEWMSSTLNNNEGGNINIDVVEFTEAGTIGCEIPLVKDAPNDGSATLPDLLTEDSPDEKLLLFCAIRITSADEPPEEALWSAYHPCLWYVARLFHKIFLNNSPLDIADIVTNVITSAVSLTSIAENLPTILSQTIGPGECNKWVDEEINNEINDPVDFSNLRIAPCTAAQARFDWGWWPTCSGDSCQFYHPGAEICYTSWWPRPSQDACYNATGSLILEGTGRGRANREFRWWFQTFNHIRSDSLPYVACCIASLNCNEYFTRRPPANCSGYVLQPRPWGGGDPHFVTFDGQMYTFNPIGEYWFIVSFELNLKIQIRMTSLALALGQGTAIVGVAVCRGSSSIVEVLLRESLVVKVGGTEQNLTGFINSVFSTPDNSVSVLLYSEDELELRFPLESACDGEVIRVRQVADVLQVSVLLPDCYKSLVKGLHGNFDGDATNDFERPPTTPGGLGLIISDTSSPERIHDLFGLYWQVDSEDSLFSYDEGESYDDYNDPSYRPSFFTDSELLSTPNGGFCDGNLQCLYDFRVTGSTEFATESRTAIEEVMEVFELSQSTSNPCLSNPCVLGVCTPLSTPTLVIYVCACPPGYGGVNCGEERCNPNPCENAGTCTPDTSTDRYSCACRLGYAGTNCERVVCDPNPCENAGTCTPDTSEVRYSCDCNVGYVGINCSMEDSATRCPRSPCRNGSQCLFIDGQYTCVCDVGYTGRYCEREITPCDLVQCLNGGTCDSETDYVCQCHPSYTGSQCETALCHVNPCQNDAACKEDENGDPRCICPPGFSGLYCHISDDDLREKTIISLVLFAIITLILLILLGFTLAALGVRCPVLGHLLAPVNPQPRGLVKVGVRQRVVVKPRVQRAPRQGPVYARPIMFNPRVFGPPQNMSYA